MESAKNPAVKDVGFSQLAQKSPAASDNDRRITQVARKSRRFDQVLDESEFGVDSNESELENICAPIQCDEEDDGPDFTRMSKKTAKGQAAVASS